mgnify:CR=1 FL=1
MRTGILSLLLCLLAGPALAASTEEIKEVAAELVCLCGDCNRESLATCLCSEFAVPQRERIGQLLDEGKSHREIIDEYVAAYGQMALAAPPPEGANLLAWIAPFAALLFGVFLIRSVLRSWRREEPLPADPSAPSGTTSNAAQRERLQRELDRFDEGE